MKKSYFAAAVFLLLVTPLQSMAAGESYEAEGLNRGTGDTGLTGLYYTVSPETQGTGITVGAYGIVQPTAAGNNVITPATVTLGLGKNVEVSAVTRLIATPATSGTGDTEVYAKYKFRSLGETMPAMAIAIGAILPTSSAAALQDVNTLGAKFMVIAGGDAQVSEEAVIGIYFNMAANFFDPGQAAQEKFLSANMGFMAPISDDHKLQAFLDIRTISGKTTPTQNYTDGTSFMLGLRYAARFMNVSAGIEKGNGEARIMGGVSFGI